VGLALLWNADICMEIKSYSHRHINATIKIKDTSPLWMFIGFYGHPDVEKRKESWNLLRYV
jgi:hypothetical protein